MYWLPGSTVYPLPHRPSTDEAFLAHIVVVEVTPASQLSDEAVSHEGLLDDEELSFFDDEATDDEEIWLPFNDEE